MIAEEKPTVQTGKLYKPPKFTDTIVKKPPEERQETPKEKADRIDKQVYYCLLQILMFKHSF